MAFSAPLFPRFLSLLARFLARFLTRFLTRFLNFLTRLLARFLTVQSSKYHVNCLHYNRAGQ